MFYILNEAGQPVATPDIMVWANWSATANPTLAFDEIDGVQISTVFLHTAHRELFPPSKDAAPLLFETMIFGEPLDGFIARYRTKTDALKQHAHYVAQVRCIKRLPVVMPLRNALMFSSKPFQCWAADHLRAPIQVFHRFRLVGFASKADAAIFKLSAWFDQMSDETDPNAVWLTDKPFP